jgi:hypothetical protein
VARGLVRAAHGEEAPLVVDPFAQIVVPMHNMEGVSSVYIVCTWSKKRSFGAGQQFPCNML